MYSGHAHGPARFDRAFAIGIALNLAFVAVEAWYGWATDSLALLADAGHNLSDVAGLALAWAGAAIGRLRPDVRHTYGWRRGSVLAAFLNAVLLLVAMGSLAWEALQRLQSPAPVHGLTIMAVAGVGIVVNGVTAWLFARGRDEDINIRGAFLHMAADALVSAGVVVAGALAHVAGWTWIDPVASLLIAAVIVFGSVGLFRQSVHLLFDGVPEDVDLGAVRALLERQPGVLSIADLHVWAMSTTQTALTAHVLMSAPVDDDAFLDSVARLLHDRFGIEHTTLQLMRRPVGRACDAGAAGTAEDPIRSRPG